MAVTASNFSHDYPEFNPDALRGRTAGKPLRNVRRNVRQSARTMETRVRRARTRQGSLAGGLLRSRLMDDLCAAVVGAAGIFFLIAVVRMLLAG